MQAAVAVVKTPLSSMILVFIASIIGSFASVLLKASSSRMQMTIVGLITNWRLVAGAAAYLVSSVFFVWGVRNGQLSILYPLVSLGYLWTMVWSRLFFGEPITRNKVAGVGLILGGIVLLSLANG